jgi:hypothetical protein
VIELDQPLATVAKVAPIPVEQPQNIPAVGELLTLVGYGHTGTDCNQPSLGKMRMDVPVAGSSWAGLVLKMPNFILVLVIQAVLL